MHELPVIKQLLAHVLNQAKKHRLTKVKKVTVSLNCLSSFVDDSIEFYWQIITQDTLAQGSKITINRGHQTQFKLTQISGD